MNSLVTLSVIMNFLLIFIVISLIGENSKLKEALRNIKKSADSALKVKDPPKTSPPDPRRKMKWKIKE